MNYDYYRTFYFVGKYKSATLAAKELFTSQPAVTRAIKKLEYELGCRLFIRSKKGMEFTHEGETLFEYVSASFNQLEKGESEIRKNTSASEGRIVIGATVTALDEFLFEFLDKFHKLNPLIKYKIFTQSTDSTIARLRSGVIDVALVTSPCALFADVEYVKILSFKNVVVCGSKFKELNEDSPISISDLKKYPFVAMSPHTQLRQYTNEIFLNHNIGVSPTIEVDSADVLIPFVKNNLGLSIVPLSLARKAIDNGEVFIVNTLEELPTRNVFMVYSKVFPNSNTSKKFIKEARKEIK